MAFPVILVDSTNGSASDTAASGAGPTTAKTGTGASSTTTTNIDITDTVDLSGVSTAGDAVIYFADTTAGHRRFARITNVTGGPSGSTWHITLDSNSPVTASVGPVSWAIGGVRATVGSATSYLLFDNNSAAGDAMPGWWVELQSGHTETISGNGVNQFVFRRSGDQTSGRLGIRTKAGAAVAPVLTFLGNTFCFVAGNSTTNYIGIIGPMELKNSNATKTASWAVYDSGASTWQVSQVYARTAGSTGQFWKGIGVSGSLVKGCEIANTASNGIEIISASGIGGEIVGCKIHNCGGDGIAAPSVDARALFVHDNVIYANTGSGINLNNSSASLGVRWAVWGNTVNGNGSDGIRIASATVALATLTIANNLLTNNTGQGLCFANASATDAYLAGTIGTLSILNNNTYNNANAYKSNTGTYAYNACPWASGDPGLNPQYVDAANGNFTPTNTALGGTAYPPSI